MRIAKIERVADTSLTSVKIADSKTGEPHGPTVRNTSHERCASRKHSHSAASSLNIFGNVRDDARSVAKISGHTKQASANTQNKVLRQMKWTGDQGGLGRINRQINPIVGQNPDPLDFLAFIFAFNIQAKHLAFNP